MIGHENKEISQEEVTKILEEAVDYAASCVQLGCTQFAKLEEHVEEKQILISDTLNFFRNKKNPSSALLRIDPNIILYYSQKIIEMSRQYSLGNCGEIACLIFSYIAEHYPKVKISIVDIKNGDHRVTMANLPKTYNFRDTETLENAMVCDGWNAWASIHKMYILPKNLFHYNRKYIWIPKENPEKSELYYCHEGKLEIVSILNKKQLKKDLDLLFTGRDKELLHPNIIRKLITGNGGHRPIGIIYPAREYKKLLKNYCQSRDGHHCEDLKDHHILEECGSSDLLHDKNYKQKMVDIFLAKIESLIEILEIYKKEILSDEKSSISKEKISLLDKKGEELRCMIKASNSENLSSENYFTLKKELERILYETFDGIMRYAASVEMSAKEATIKFYYHIKQLEKIYIGKKETIFLLFIARMNLFKETVERFKLELLEIKKQLNEQEAQVIEIITEKLKFANQLIGDLSRTIEDYQNKDVSEKNYYTWMSEFLVIFESRLADVEKLGNFDENELSVLKKYDSQIKDARIAFRNHLMEITVDLNEFLESGKVKLEDRIEVDADKEYFPRPLNKI